MSKNRTKTSLIHKSGNQTFEISKEKTTGKLFIKNTDTEVSPDKVMRISKRKSNYNFSKPFQAQNLGDEWSDYAWSGSDF